MREDFVMMATPFVSEREARVYSYPTMMHDGARKTWKKHDTREKTPLLRTRIVH